MASKLPTGDSVKNKSEPNTDQTFSLDIIDCQHPMCGIDHEVTQISFVCSQIVARIPQARKVLNEEKIYS